ncbi:hypothetical protein I7I48_08813 [Histoplasma ohiense]|nr:hypothetical protein I7I48_08813 [Histoplasma ohiense (nom. inval.)]
MYRYGRDLRDIDNPANLLPLTPDILKCFDKRWFVIVPKIAGGGGAHETDNGTRSARYVSHILSEAEYWPTYHNTIVQYLESDSRPYLFARFAWAILLSVKPFVTNGEPLNVIRLEVSTGAEETQKVWTAEFLSGAQLKANYSGGGSKSADIQKEKIRI